MKNYHLIGIAGIGMGALAHLLIAKGCKVSGSDLRQNTMTDELRSKGAEIFQGHDEGNLRGVDIVVHSTAIGNDNPEMSAARKKGIKIFGRAELLAELMEGSEGITVAGAHGKTTTTSMVAHMLIEAGSQPTVAVGGVIHNIGSNALLGEGKYFIAEVDESDGSFTKFSPKYSVITNIDHEHVDFYKSYSDVEDGFREFIGKTIEGGIVIGCGDDRRLKDLMVKSGKRSLFYGISGENDIVAENIEFEGFGSTFDCRCGKESLGSFTLSVPGRHNILDALACIALGKQLSVDIKIIRKSLETFEGVKRRFQVAGEAKGILIVDDYAHHPTEIRETIAAALSIKEKHDSIKRLVTVFQPHRYSRLKAFEEDFIKSLIPSDHIVVTDVYAASEEPIEGVNSENFCQHIKKETSAQVNNVPRDELNSFLLGFVVPGDLVLLLGAGDIIKVGKVMADELNKKEVFN